MRLLADLGIDTVTALDKKIGKAVGLQGTGQIRDTPFRVVAQLLSPDATVNNGENKLTLRAWAANNVIDVAGTLPSLADVENVPLQDARAGAQSGRTARRSSASCCPTRAIMRCARNW